MAVKNDIHAFLGTGTSFEGTLRFQGMVRIDSKFEGTVESEGMLVLGEKAHIKGSVTVGQLVSAGTVDGELVATVSATLQKGSLFLGTLTTPTINMEEGARFEGRVIMNKEKPSDPVRPVSPGEGGDAFSSKEKKSWFKR
ncbi:bactofilin family protein [Oceanidesulfovibrio marinus]|uniref:Polymer-forming cytoskeletal protein n=1 Tax=Oceanidesulfovibrio marinus TaxID=370038 RepID=A0A6P1ZJG3_9BACT|nr:polymer-forming cytoskeletal protein [Oceanidesulfovibrio marinus]QJT10686.1 polymer-forming cytoskeletal protein [Oceanidesulfovibrio marinus]TVM34087.1 polymer-forming cytoskeletal protein [Oceanidesulfovibrio marinus]